MKTTKLVAEKKIENFFEKSSGLFLLEGENVGDVANLGRGVGRGEAGLESGLLGCVPKG